MTRLAEQLLVSEVSKKALQLLNQPPNILERGTPYQGPETPFYQDATEPSPDEVKIYVSWDRRYGSFFGDSDHWDRSEACVLPAASFYRLLARLGAGKEVSQELPATIIETDIAWGIDCANPHETINHKEESVSVHVEISTDMKTIILQLLRRKGNEFVPYATLQQCETELR